MGEMAKDTSSKFRIFRMASSDPSLTHAVRTFEYNPDYPRCSTPLLTSTDVVIYTQWSLKAAAYRIFHECLQEPPIRRTVRGLKKVPNDLMAGHLISSEEKWVNSFNSFDLSISNASKFAKGWRSLKKRLRKLFRKFFGKFFRNKCDTDTCDLDCECRDVKDLLNRRIEVEEEG